MEWPAWLHLDAWDGQTKQPITVVGETRTRYRIRTPQDDPDRRIRLAGRARSLADGETALVPKHAVTPRETG